MISGREVSNSRIYIPSILSEHNHLSANPTDLTLYKSSYCVGVSLNLSTNFTTSLRTSFDIGQSRPSQYSYYSSQSIPYPLGLKINRQFNRRIESNLYKNFPSTLENNYTGESNCSKTKLTIRRKERKKN